MYKLAAALLIVVAVAGCSGGKPAAHATTPKPSPSASVSPGPDAFMASVAKVGFADKDTTDRGLIDVGNTTCQGLADGVSFGQQVQVYVEAGATEAQAGNFVRSAVKNLCPEQAPMLP